MNTNRIDEEVGFQIGYERASFGFCRQDLEAMGERSVRGNLNSGKYGHVGIASFDFVSAWLADAEFSRLEVSSAKRDAREVETLSIAKEANRIASSATLWAKWAAILATISIAIGTKDQILALIFGHL